MTNPKSKTAREILEEFAEVEYCYGHKEQTGQWITNNICNTCGLPISKKKAGYIDKLFSDLVELIEAEKNKSGKDLSIWGNGWNACCDHLIKKVKGEIVK